MTDPDIRLQITPEPTDEEAAAVAAAIALLSAVRLPEQAAESKRTMPRWSLAGRFAAHNASPAAGNRRWSDANAWLKR